MKYGWWLEKVYIRIPGEDFRDISETLQKKLSFGIPVLAVNLAGEVISGKKTCAVIVSKKLQAVSLFFIFKRFLLKSPAKMISAFRLSKLKSIEESSSINCL